MNHRYICLIFNSSNNSNDNNDKNYNNDDDDDDNRNHENFQIERNWDFYAFVFEEKMKLKHENLFSINLTELEKWLIILHIFFRILSH